MWNRQQQQIIWGTLLGKAYITRIKRKNYFLTIPENRDQNWLRYKAIVIDGEKTSFIADRKRLIWRSRCQPVWNEMYEAFYDNELKVVRMDILDRLGDEGLCTWFLDKGKFVRRKLILGTTVFGYSGNQIIARYFNEVDMPCEIRKERGTGKIAFTEEGTRAFVGTIRRIIPEFMAYRLLDIA